MSGKLRVVTLGSPGDEILHEDLTKLESNPKVVAGYYAEMSRLCKDHHGVGLSANQVGLRENFFFVAGKGKLLPTPGGVLVINPAWSPHRDAKRYTAKAEGCLSLPLPNGHIGTRKFDVTRFTKIVASWVDTNGNFVKPRTISGYAAQIFQHEHDHLRGVMLTDHGVEVTIM